MGKRGYRSLLQSALAKGVTPADYPKPLPHMSPQAKKV